MSMELMVKAMKTKVGNPLRKLVLIKLADNANDMGECWPSYQHIADQCEIGRSTVKVHIRELEKCGLLRREFRRKGELNQSNLFHLSLMNSGAGAALPGAGDNPGGGAGAAPRTSHSFEPVKEPVKQPVADAPSAKKKAPKFDPLTCKPANVSEQVWADWCQHRKEIRKPLTKTTCERQAKTLAGHHWPDAVIIQSISNGWTGLFPDKVVAGGNTFSNGPDFYDQSWRTDTSDDL
ncbi:MULTISPECIES: helix-turn-helix domain-containing protein [Pseudomonas]|uniref:Helix-turn-helix domain-containing protein n=1 Tax=Pseudomonas lactis TaxID=1615674 RepID=A0ABS9FMB0_9PSED|nr:MULTISPECIES: helix-turn-helix domain-containing protein [Pseudomonas]MBI6975115.1 helix-turn-helix domain-containing protein [Pseudomonas lactis]MCF4974155.1 helix-turn-helix domain-containing protein [Pseudomonas lactis]MCF5003928.1 helix-turn-helix domain-containing protein [Pseudomonas lactis]MCF5009225.1 helix-turn-helix domain-containing protein [Pseudomonas lactis]MCF5014688.1 helix-turn-helix domain-containing protein [Pseudomonas lactis]